MATNQVFEEGDELSLVVTDPASPKSGDPVIVGQLAGVALTNKRADGTTSVDTDGVYRLSVKGVDTSGNKAIAAGDVVYYTAADTPKLSVKNTGVRYGIALDAVTGGSTTTIRVRIGY